MLYGSTKEFLTIFGLANLNDLPEVQGLTREASWTPAKSDVEEDGVEETTEVAQQPIE